jgi:hypothetical protein
MAITGTLQHPKITRLAQLLDCPAWGALGMAEALWIFTAQYARHGAIGRLLDSEIADGVKWGGKPSELIEALVAAGLVDRLKHDPANRLVVHDWPVYCPDYIRKRMERHNETFWDGQAPRSQLSSGSNSENGFHNQPKREPKPKRTVTETVTETPQNGDAPERAGDPSHPIPSHSIRKRDLSGTRSLVGGPPEKAAHRQLPDGHAPTPTSAPIFAKGKEEISEPPLIIRVAVPKGLSAAERQKIVEQAKARHAQGNGQVDRPAGSGPAEPKTVPEPPDLWGDC